MTRYSAEKNAGSVSASVSAGVLFSLALSLPIVLIFILFRNRLTFLFTDKRCMDILMIILPGLVITSVYAVLRGSFWGNKDFLTYSVIELLEEAVMLAAGIILVERSTSMMSGVTRAAWSVVISYIFSFTASGVIFFIKKGRLSDPRPVMGQLISSSLPITGMRTATSLINSLIAVILPARLIAAGMTRSLALSEFGAAFGMAVPILFMPGTLIGSLAVVLVPELSENYYKKQTRNLQSNVLRALEFSAFIACAAIPVICSFGEEFGELFFKSQQAGKYLVVSAPIMLPMSVSMITTSMLNSLNKEKKTLLFYLFGAAFLLACILFLTKYIGIYSLAAGMFCQFTVTAILNIVELDKKTHIACKFSAFAAKDVAIAAASVLFGVMLNNIFEKSGWNGFPCIGGGIAVALFYSAICFAFGLTAHVVPKGKKRSSLLREADNTAKE